MSHMPDYLDQMAAETNTAHYNLAAEQAVLGGLLQQPEAFDQIVSLLKPEDFFNRHHAIIFQTITSMIDAGRAVDTITLAETLEGAEQLHQVGGLVFLASLAQEVAGAANIRHYAEIVRERAIHRELTAIGIEAASAGNRPGHLQEKLNDLQEKINTLNDRRAAKKPVRIGELIIPAEQEIAQAEENGGFTGLSTGLDDLDEKTAGLAPGDFVVIGGRPGMGKTALAVGIGQYNAMQHDLTTLLWAGEMRSVAVAKRMIGSTGKIPGYAMRTGKMGDENWEKFMFAASKLKDIPFFIDDEPGISVTVLKGKARTLKREVGLDLLIVDFLQLMSSTRASDSRVNEISAISRGLKSLAMELEIPVIALSSLNRSVEQRPNKRPNMADLRESGQIESDADLIMFVYRDEVYHPDTPDKGTAEIIIGKQRAGALGTVRTTFIEEQTRFVNYMGRPLAEAYADEKPQRGFRG